ncbi:uncharacterized protein [Heptranchias perlo]|uniref:uncharacterized protein isoform X1 n=1 Tax=Heptranchias perlo TaxID=212740 RepID=UPI003559DD01
MELPLAALAVSVLLGQAHTLKCYRCSGSKCDSTQSAQICEGADMCQTQLDWQLSGNVPSEKVTKSCSTSQTCTNISLNLGSIIRKISCCNEDLCNSGPSVDEDGKTATMHECYGCLTMLNDFKCNRTGRIKCTDSQTKCGRLQTVFSQPGRNISLDFQGCLSESVCQLNSTAIIFEVEIGKSFECCSGNLCNRGPRPGTGSLCLIFLCFYLLATNSK